MDDGQSHVQWRRYSQGPLRQLREQQPDQRSRRSYQLTPMLPIVLAGDTRLAAFPTQECSLAHPAQLRHFSWRHFELGLDRRLRLRR